MVNACNKQNLFFLLKDYSIKQSVIKNHYPLKYWINNKNAFIHLTFWVWFCWILMALISIIVPVSNTQRLGHGVQIAFESTFNYIVKILGNYRGQTNYAQNLSPAFWNYEAYIFLYTTIASILLSCYSLFLLKNYHSDVSDILAKSDNSQISTKISKFFKAIKYLTIAGIILTIWTTFGLLYLKKPVEERIGTIFFAPKVASGEKEYTKPLTVLGKITCFSNISSLFIIIFLYSKYVRELFIGNSFFFKQFRLPTQEKKDIVIDPLIRQNFQNSFNVKRGKEFEVKNRKGYIAELSGVNKYFKVGEGYFHALKNINLKIKDGDFIVILGYSGSGKTTLLNLLAGIDRPTDGKCIISNSNTTNMTDQDLNLFRRKKIGYIFQNYALLPNLTAQENIAITQNMDGTPFKDKWETFINEFRFSSTNQQRIVSFIKFLKNIFISPSDKEEVKYLMDVLNLSEHKDKYPHQLSGGQQQRVSIIRALIKKPKILLADEPTGAIDHSTTKSILEMFYNINTYSKTTIILITHNPLIAKMAKRVLHISNGTIERDVINEKPLRPHEIEGL